MLILFFTACCIEQSPGVLPSLFVLCIAYWFTSLRSLARYDEPGVNFMALRNLVFIAIRFCLIPLRCADESTKNEPVLSAD